MAYLGDTGQGGTVALDTSSVGRVIQAELPQWVMEAINAIALEDTGFIKKIPADLSDAGVCAFTAIFAATGTPPSPGTVEQITVTFPIGESANTTAATLVGTGFLTTVGMPTMETNTLMELAFEFTFDADTGPTFTPEAA